MSNIMVTNYLADTRPNDRPDPKAQVDPGREDNFARYLDKKVRSERRARSGQLGVKHHTIKDQQAARGRERQKADSKHDDGTANVAAFLQQLLADLKNLSDQPNKQAAGEWNFQLKSMDMLRKLAAEAGMSAKELTAWQKQLDSKGMINLRDILAALEQHFRTMQQPGTVTAPETDLPVVESILDRMGVDPAALSALAAKSVNDKGGFDLKAYLKGLEKLSAAKLKARNDQAAPGAWPVVKVSAVDMRQLRDMLGSAGLTRGQLLEMFPGSLTSPQADGRAAKGGGPQMMSMDRLQELLGQTINMVEDAKPEIKPVGFLNNLVDVLQQAGFVKKDTSWSPVVQKSLTAVYQQLQKMVDLSKVKIEKTNEIIYKNEALAADWQKSSLSDTGTDMTDGEQFAGQLAKDDSGAALVNEPVDGHVSKGKKLENGGEGLSPLPSSAVPLDSRSADALSAAAVRPRAMTAPAILQQFAFEQISQGVTQALQRDDHHLVLTMYPKELGEVKVDLQVRNNHVMVSFVMDNHRVKETLEKNMEEFKQNLNQQGYNLESCMVMVGQHNDSEDSRQRFESAWEQLNLDKGRQGGGKSAALETSAPPSRAFLRADRWSDSQISVLV